MTRYYIRNCSKRRLEELGVSDIRQTHRGTITFATLSDEQAKKLQSEGCKLSKVSYVRTGQLTIPDMTVNSDEETSEDVYPPPYIEPPSEYTPSELIQSLGFDTYRELMDPPLFGENVNIAIIDSGIRKTHNAIGESKVVYSENFTDSADGDFFNHGTGVAEIILTVAPEANLLDLKIISDEGYGSSEDLVMAVDKCIALNDEGSEYAPRIINLSLGTEDDGDPEDPMRVVCREALEQGIWIVAAAGNAGPEPETVMSPSTEEYVLCVGSVTREPIKISDFSARGPTLEGLVKPDMVFFGDSIRMASSDSDTSYVTKSGTSFSAPFVSGIAALHIEAISKIGGYETVFPYEQLDERLRLLSTIQNFINAYLKKISIKPTEDYVPDKDTAYGWGIPYGDYLAQSYFSEETSNTGNISEIMEPMIMLMMVGAMFGMIGKMA